MSSWKCEQCLGENSDDAARCALCGAEKPTPATQPQQQQCKTCGRIALLLRVPVDNPALSTDRSGGEMLLDMCAECAACFRQERRSLLEWAASLPPDAPQLPTIARLLAADEALAAHLHVSRLAEFVSLVRQGQIQ